MRRTPEEIKKLPPLPKMKDFPEKPWPEVALDKLPKTFPQAKVDAELHLPPENGSG
jgi:hypothetical protein